MRKTICFIALFLILLCGCSQQPASVPTESPAPSIPAALDLTDTICTPEDYLAAASENPASEIIWSVPLSSGSASSSSVSLALSDLNEADLDLIAYFPNLTAIDLTASDNYALISELAVRYPDISVAYTVEIGGTLYPSDFDGEITLTEPDAEELTNRLPYLPEVSQITLLGTLPDTETLVALKEGFPNITFLWDFIFLGVPVNTLTESVDLQGIELSDTAELESMLSCFYQLKTVDLCGSNLSNTDMEALNRNHPCTDFVWEVQIGRLMVRTDSIYLVPSKFGITSFHPSNFANMKYLTKLQLLDLGHYMVQDISFLAYMPDLKYLSLNSGTFKDLTPIGYCQDLEYLELFLSTGTDLWPLVNCAKLKNLNISYMPYCDPRPLHRMAWLDRLWIANASYNQKEKTALQEALPYTVILFESTSSTNKGWRNSPSYYALRDLAGMGYMTK